MIELRGGLESFGAMTVTAIWRKCLLVIVGMACLAGGNQPEVGEFFSFCFLILNELRFVTVGALFFCMGTGQREAAERVVEFFLCKPDDLEIYAVMVTVTGNTFLIENFGGGMITFPGVDTRFQFGVALQAFLVGNLLSQDMAPGTI